MLLWPADQPTRPKALASIGWRREDVFITNVVKCRPPDNRDPEPDEIAACAPFLRRQLEALDPALVVTLGRYSMGTFMPGARIGQAHGTLAPVDPATGARDAFAFAMYHPAAGLHQARIDLFSEEAEAVRRAEEPALRGGDGEQGALGGKVRQAHRGRRKRFDIR